jgi:hypothetical protein
MMSGRGDAVTAAAWTPDKCCLCGKDAAEDPALVVRIAGQIAGYLCDDAHALAEADPQLAREFVDWVRGQYPGRAVTVEIPAQWLSYTLDPA